VAIAGDGGGQEGRRPLCGLSHPLTRAGARSRCGGTEQRGEGGASCNVATTESSTGWCHQRRGPKACFVRGPKACFVRHAQWPRACGPLQVKSLLIFTFRHEDSCCPPCLRLHIVLAVTPLIPHPPLRRLTFTSQSSSSESSGSRTSKKFLSFFLSTWLCRHLVH
jgi:hypothetical protein